MATLTPSQIGQVAYSAGFRSNSLTIAIAVALAESGGNTAAINHNTNGSTDYGLWQINSIHSQYNPTLLLSNPAYNAQAAWALSSHGANWQPWTTYNTGAYRKFLTQAQQATGASVGSSTGGAATASMTVDQVFTAKGLWKWYSSRVTNAFNGTSERGADYSAPWGTPIGVIVGGRVVRIVHNNNSIGDVVEIQSSDSSATLYQHIRTRVVQGQSVSTGDIVGTEDGLPVDQYSTGPHIEVRYAPPGRYVFSAGSWNNGWVNPVPFFSSIGGRPATGPSVSLDNTGFGTFAGTSGGPYVPLTYTHLTAQVHQTLVSTPGFYGIALAVDEAEQFPGWVNLAQGLTDFQGIARSIGATITDNFLPFAIRSGLVTLGMILIVLLMVKPMENIAKVVTG